MHCSNSYPCFSFISSISPYTKYIRIIKASLSLYPRVFIIKQVIIKMKKMVYNHTQSFNKLEHSTKLSSHILECKNRNEPQEIDWSIKGRTKKCNPPTKKCRLCIKEKFHIIFQLEDAGLNERFKLFSTLAFRHVGACLTLLRKI